MTAGLLIIITDRSAVGWLLLLFVWIVWLGWRKGRRMAKRQAIFTVKSDEVQGEGSFVKVRAVLYGEAKLLRKSMNGMSEEEKVAKIDQLLIEHVFDWDWVDDDGNPLPLPKDDPDVLNRLTAQEINFLGNAMNGSPADQKK